MNVKMKEPNGKVWWIGAIVICLLLWGGGYMLTNYIFFNYFPVGKDNCAPALFGDSFGAVNALISAFAFAGMIVTFVLQRYELGMQRQELEAQREEFSTQNETLRLQRFENTFFNMMELQQSIVNDLYAKDWHKNNILEDNPSEPGRLAKEVITADEFKGRNLFFYIFCKYEYDIGTFSEPQKVNGLFGVLCQKGLNFIENYTTTTLDHYYRHLYTILKFIDGNVWLGKEEQYKYATFLRATLSRYELVMLFYNGLHHPKLKKLMEKYCILNNLRPELLALSLENNRYLQNINIKDFQELCNQGFSCRDYEFSLTTQKDDDTKYYLGAFYTDEEIQRGIDLLNRWNHYIAGRLPFKQ